MRNQKKIIFICLFLFIFSTGTSNSQSNWAQKGMNILNTLDGNTQSNELSVGEIGDAFKEALRIGSANVVTKLSNIDGFNADPAVHIPLPRELNTVKAMLDKIGMTPLVNDLELKLNRAAEAATPKAKELFLQSINAMTFNDIKDIYEGPQDSATRYFQKTMSPSLSKEMHKIVEESLSQVGAIQSFDNVMGKYQSIPFVPNIKANLTDHVVQKGMDGIFHYIAQEEASIRENPAKQTTDLLKKVFGTK